MSSKNFVLLIGNVGNVDVKDIGDGKKLVQVSLATSDGYKGKDGEWKENTEWHKCVFAIQNLVERAEKISKGDKIEVTGSIRTNKWTDKEGNEQSYKEISVVSFKTWSKAKGNDAPTEEMREPASAGKTDDDDLPF